MGNWELQSGTGNWELQSSTGNWELQSSGAAIIRKFFYSIIGV